MEGLTGDIQDRDMEEQDRALEEQGKAMEAVFILNNSVVASINSVAVRLLETLMVAIMAFRAHTLGVESIPTIKAALAVINTEALGAIPTQDSPASVDSPSMTQQVRTPPEVERKRSRNRQNKGDIWLSFISWVQLGSSLIDI